MGRPRKHNRHLPQAMMMRRGAYYLLAYAEGRQRWIPLGRDYAQALHAYAEHKRGEPLPFQNVSGLLAAYLADRALTRSAKTLQGYRLDAARLTEVFGALRLADVRRADIARYMALRGNVAANRERDLFRAAWNWALNSGVTEAPNPMAGMRLRNAEGVKAKATEYVEDATMLALDRAASPAMRMLMRFLYLTGMRLGDALRLELSAGTEAGIAWRTGKTGKRMLVEWSPELRRTWQAAAASREIGPLFVSRKGKAYTVSGIETMFARLRRKAQVSGVTLHGLRAKAADDVPLRHAQELLGHADSGITQRHYRRRAQPVKPVR